MVHVYLITNGVNGKRYVGFTKRSIEKRFEGHCRAADRDGSCYALHEAMRKHGIENFYVELLEICLDRPTAALREQALIIELDTHVRNGRGYNMTKGGEGVTGLSQASIDSMAEKHRRENLRPETLERMALAKNGTKLSEETRAKQSKRKKGKKFTDEHRKNLRGGSKQPRAVDQLTMEGEFIARYPSFQEAFRQTGAYPTNISYVCKGKYRYAGGFKWRYAVADQNDD